MLKYISARKRRSLSLVAVAAASGLVLAGCAGAEEAEEAAPAPTTDTTEEAQVDVSIDEIVVGLIMPTTGQMSVLGVAQADGVKVVINEINEAGGIYGVPIRLVEGDSQSDPGVGATVAQRLIDTEDVDILIGSYSSGIASSMLPIAQRNDVVLWEVGSVSTAINPDGNPNFLRTVGNASTYAGSAIDFLVNFIAPELGVDVSEIPVAILNEDGAFGTSVGEVYDQLAEEYNLNVVFRSSYPITTPDFTPLLLQLKEAAPEVLLTVPSVADAQLFWEQAQVQDFNVKAVIGSSGFTAPSFPERFGVEGVEGVFGVEPPALANMNLDGLEGELRTQVEKWLADFEELNGSKCLVHCGDGIGGAYVLFYDVLPRALENTGAVETAAILEAAMATDLQEGQSPQGFGVKFVPATAGDNSSGDNERGVASVMQWSNGELRVVWPANIAAGEPVFPMPTWSER